MRTSQLRVPDMELKDLIPFVQGIMYAEEYYGINGISEATESDENEKEEKK